MRTNFFSLLLLCFALSCNSNTEKKESAATPATEKTAVELPYKASFSGNWTQDVSDADLKTVLQSYKDWETGNITGLVAAFGDTLEMVMANGDYSKKPSGELAKIFTTYRDSISNVKIDMGAWDKMHSVDKNTDAIVTWYDEWDTYKNGKVDSASYHDVNVLKNGKIVYYATYKKPKK